MIGLEYILETFNTNANQLANDLGISRYTVYDWLKERRNIPEKRLEQLSKYFDLPKEYFNKTLDSLDKSKIEEILAKKKLESNPDDRHLQFKFELAKNDKEIEQKLKSIQITILEIMRLNYLKDITKLEELLAFALENENIDDIEEGDTATQIFFNRIEKYLDLHKQDNEVLLSKIDNLLFADTKK